jgi:hypothetical protein
MKKGWIFLITGLAIITLLSCYKNGDDLYFPEADQHIYFQYEYINYAWGYQHYGWLIDSTGKVFCYHNPENWNFPDSLGFINTSDMDSNISETDSICYKIDIRKLNDKTELIFNASKGKISEPVHEMYDAGGSVYSAFLYNKNTGKYKKILLKQEGDFRIENSSTEADELYTWLKSVNYLINTTE